MFNPFESSRSKGRPIELYYFEYGTKPDAYSAQTNCERQITRAGVSYQPVSITRSNIVVTGSLDRAQLDVLVGKSNPIGELFRVSPPPAPVNLTILEGHYGDTDADYKQIWGGRVVTVSFEKSQLKLICEPIATKTQNAGLKRHWQVQCPHILYGSRCRVLLSSYLQTSTVIAISNNVVQLPEGWHGSLSAAKFLGGMIQWPSTVIDADMRTVIKVVDDRHLRVAYVPKGLSVGDTIKLAPGCDHSLAGDCTSLFNNARNYGGSPFIPYKNPVNNFSNFF